MLKKLLCCCMAMLFIASAHSKEIIKIYSPYSAGHSGTTAMRAIIDTANNSQDTYNFILEFKPGGNQLIALHAIEPANSLAIIAPAFIDNVQSNKIKETDYVPVHALGDVCWAVIANKQLRKNSEIVVGAVGYGNATHLTAIALSKKYGFDVNLVIFKSNYDALVNMAGDNGVNLVIDRFESYEALKSKNNKMQVIAASCSTRLPQAPKIKTLEEIGINSPLVFNITIAHKDMPKNKQQEIGSILDSATLKVGKDKIYSLSAMNPPIFNKISTEEFYKKNVELVKNLQNLYKNEIEQSKGNK